MKKRVYLFIVIFVIISVTQSCLMVKKVVPEVGLERSSIESTEEDTWEPGIGVQAGVCVPVYDINKLVSIRAGVSLSLHNANWGEGRATFLYGNVPMVIRYQRKNGFFGEVGIQPGLLLLAREKLSDASQNNSYNALEYYNKFDLGIPVGIGYEFKNNFGIGLRVIPGLLNINVESPSPSVNTKAHNLVIALRGTYSLRFR